MKYENQLRIAVGIVNDYDGRVPLSAWLKDFYRSNKQMGSRDRKTVSALVYGYYRLGHTSYNTIKDRMLAALALVGGDQAMLDYFNPAKPVPSPTSIFPWPHLLSDGLDAEAFSLSFLQQPDLFIRIRPDYEGIVQLKLKEAGLNYQLYGENCVALPNTTKLEDVLAIDKQVVIQDKTSQQTGSFFPKATNVWDACAASGGKSIMAFDIIPGLDITVSDVRSSIIQNLKDRFRRAGIKAYSSFIADLSDPAFKPPASRYDFIIADVPCSGSGTWARTPEQLCFFNEEKIDHYAALQQKIVQQLVPALKPGGSLVYITCSVFKKENEDAVRQIVSQHPLRIDAMQLLSGFTDRADSMFVARLMKEDDEG